MNYSRKNNISQQKNDGQSDFLGITQSSGLDTQITATFVVGRLRLEKAVPFGQPAAGFLPTEEELVSALRPVVGWTPSPDLPLFQDTTFEPIYQDTEEPGLLRWRWSR